MSKYNFEIDGKFKSTTAGNVDWYYGGGSEAYVSLALARAGVPSSLRAGTTVGVLENNKISEYIWHNDNLTDEGLVIKFPAYIHPSDGFEVDLEGPLAGASVINNIEVNLAGHVIGLSKRDLTLVDLNYTGDLDADKYTSWNLKTNGFQRTGIFSGSDLDLAAGANVSITYSAGGVVTFSSENTIYTHPLDGADLGSALTGASVISDVDVNTKGHVIGFATRDLTLLDLSFTGDSNANYVDVDLVLNSTMTGLSEGGELTINTNTAKFDIAIGFGRIINGHSTVESPTSNSVAWNTITGITPQFLATHNASYVSMNSSGEVYQTSSPLTSTQRRNYIKLGVIVHPNRSTIFITNDQPSVHIEMGAQVQDVLEVLGFRSVSGNRILPAAATGMEIKKDPGVAFKPGANFKNLNSQPHFFALPEQNVVSFRYRLQDGTEGLSTTTIDPTKYDLNGVLTAIPATATLASVQQVFIFQEDDIRIQPGQKYYNNLAESLLAINSSVFQTEENIAANGLYLGSIAMIYGTTDLDNILQAVFVPSQGTTANGSITLPPLGYTPEDEDNKVQTLSASAILYPSNNAVIAGLSLKQNILAEGAFVDGDKNNLDEAYAHITRDGTEHTFINQDLRTNFAPTFSNVFSSNNATANDHLVRLDQMNSAIAGLDWQESVLDQINFTTTEPTGSATGDRYINTVTGVGSTTTGTTFTKDRIYEWDFNQGGNWVEFIPNEGFTVWDESVDTNLTFNGTAWVEFGSTVSHNNTTGLQGGLSGQYYHLSAAQYADLTDGGNATIHTHTLDSLSDTLINSIAPNEILKWNGIFWVNNTLAEAGIQPAGNYEPAFTKNTAFNKNFGSSAGTVTEGNDPRLEDERAPTYGSGNYIQNQNSSDQSATLRISGTGVFGSSVSAEKATINGGESIGSITDFATKSNTIFKLANPVVRLGIGYNSADIPLIQGFSSTNAVKNISLNPYGGNIMIGTSTNNGAKLDVVGDVRISNSNTGGASTTLRIGSYSGNNNDQYGGAIRAYHNFGSSYDADLAFFANANNERMRIKGNGNVLIGTQTDNGSKLQVNGAATFASNVTIQGNQYFNGEIIQGDGKEMFRYSDAWLRINDDNDFTSGIYCGTGILRADGEFQIGNNGQYTKITSSGEAIFASSVKATRLDLFGASGDVIKIKPSTNNSSASIFGVNAADTAVKWSIKNDGSAVFTSTVTANDNLFLRGASNPIFRISDSRPTINNGFSIGEINFNTEDPSATFNTVMGYIKMTAAGNFDGSQNSGGQMTIGTYENASGLNSAIVIDARGRVSAGFTPTSNQHLANKLYVDSQIASGGSFDTSSFIQNNGSSSAQNADIHINGKAVVAQMNFGSGGNGKFYSDSSGRTSYSDGDFYIQSSVTNYYNYSPSIYLGNTSGTDVKIRGNSVTANNWNINTAGAATFSSSVSTGASGSTQGHIVLHSTTASAEGNIYGRNGGGMLLNTHSNNYPIQVDGSSFNVSSPATFASNVTATDYFGKWYGKDVADVAFKNTVNNFTRQQHFQIQNLTTSTNTAWNLTTQQKARVLHTTNLTMSAPTNLRSGATYVLYIQHDNAIRTFDWNSVFKWPGGNEPNLSSAGNKLDIIRFESDGIYMYATSVSLNYLGDGGGTEFEPGDTTDPSAPTDPVSVVQAGNDMQVSWNRAEDNVGIASYKIYWKVSGGSYAYLATISEVSGTQYYNHVNSFSNGTNYVYKILAVDTSGNEGPYSSEANDTYYNF